MSGSADKWDTTRFTITLTEADAVVTIPAVLMPSRIYRRILLRWNWDVDEIGKHEILLPLVPDRETAA